jgi:hypothetical protein
MNFGPSVIPFGIQNERPQNFHVLVSTWQPYRRVEVFAGSHRIGLGHRRLTDWLNDQTASLNVHVSGVQQLVKRGIEFHLNVVIAIRFTLKVVDRTGDLNALFDHLKPSRVVNMVPQRGIASCCDGGVGGGFDFGRDSYRWSCGFSFGAWAAGELEAEAEDSEEQQQRDSAFHRCSFRLAACGY